MPRVKPGVLLQVSHAVNQKDRVKVRGSAKTQGPPDRGGGGFSTHGPIAQGRRIRWRSGGYTELSDSTGCQARTYFLYPRRTSGNHSWPPAYRSVAGKNACALGKERVYLPSLSTGTARRSLDGARLGASSGERFVFRQ